MNPLITELVKHKKFNEIKEDIINNVSLNITGVVASAKAHIIYGLYNYTQKKPVIVCANSFEARKMMQDLKYYSTQEVVFFPAREVIYYNVESQSRETNDARMYAINKIINNDDCIIVTTIDALMQPMPSREVYEKKNTTYKVGQNIYIQEVVKSLEANGYERCDSVEAKGQYAVRGGIVDLFPIKENSGIRIEWFGNTIDTIREIALKTQRSVKNISSVCITASNEFVPSIQVDVVKKLNEFINGKISAGLKNTILEDIETINNGNSQNVLDKYFELFVTNPVSLLSYFNNNHVVYINEPSAVEARGISVVHENEEMQKTYIEKQEIHSNFCFKYYDVYEILNKELNNVVSVKITNLSQIINLTAKRKEYTFSCREVNFFRSGVDIFVQEIQKAQKEGQKIACVFATSAKVNMVSNILSDRGIRAKYIESLDMVDNLDSIYVTLGVLSSGFAIADFNLMVYSEEISGVSQVETRSKKANKKTSLNALGEILNSYQDLKIGDYVVHINHGIGKYLGTETVELGGILRDYIKIEYKDNGILFVSIDNLYTIKKYICEESFEPRLNRLSGKEWQATKIRVNEHIKDIAEDLVKLYSKRANAIGYAFSSDGNLQREAEADFEYELTEDQQRAIDEVKADMESEKPMDRLLCGDVGYGKTEVALRAAFKCVGDLKQVVYLVPTTVLAMQQYNVFKSRMEKFGIVVEMLSRFKTKKEQEEIIKRIKQGKVDVIVGTHRLLSSDIIFKDLALLIIDEEHRFGVEHKEKIKKLRNNIDVLSMTATPIPRTLHMSMLGIRDISVILTPPQARLPIHTIVSEYDELTIKEGIERELARSGQVFYIYNRVDNIESVVAKVKMLAPNAKITYAHGQMSANEIENTMLDYINKKYDVLVCTTILESGIDIPNANTIIIENADKMGLAQLYQIRGRVGRSTRTSYAYITYKRNNIVSEDAMKRLSALKDFTEFGSGFKIALKDLEIRGAGNLLGAAQHGHILQVGYDMYQALLKKAVDEEKLKALGEKQVEEDAVSKVQNEVKLIIPVSACIPSEYIESSQIKIEMYQKLSNATNKELKDIKEELQDRFGDLPTETLNLISVIAIRNRCREYGIDCLKVTEDEVLFLSKYVKNNIKYRLTFELKRDILKTLNTMLNKIGDLLGARVEREDF